MQIRCPCPYAVTQPFHCYAQIPKEVLKPSIRRRACSLLQYLRGRELVQYGREQMSNVVEMLHATVGKDVLDVHLASRRVR